MIGMDVEGNSFGFMKLIGGNEENDKLPWESWVLSQGPNHI
jgi:hypothetical protein